MPKFWEKLGQLYDKRILSKMLVLAFFSDCYVPNTKVHAKPPPYEEIKRSYQKSVFSVFSAR